jgi:hypothetical protein
LQSSEDAGRLDLVAPDGRNLTSVAVAAGATQVKLPISAGWHGVAIAKLQRSGRTELARVLLP